MIVQLSTDREVRRRRRKVDSQDAGGTDRLPAQSTTTPRRSRRTRHAPTPEEHRSSRCSAAPARVAPRRLVISPPPAAAAGGQGVGPHPDDPLLRGHLAPSPAHRIRATSRMKSFASGSCHHLPCRLEVQKSDRAGASTATSPAARRRATCWNHLDLRAIQRHASHRSRPSIGTERWVDHHQGYPPCPLPRPQRRASSTTSLSTSTTSRSPEHR